MALFLVEVPVPDNASTELDGLFKDFEAGAKSAGGSLIEIQVGIDAGRVFAIFEHDAAEKLDCSLRERGLAFDDVAPVRLVGTTLEEVKAKRPEAGYLVEWDIPAGVTMEQYLSRKSAKAPLYAKVPETTFLRTYVREDMMKCLCFYDAPDEDAVLRARQAVDTPVDRLTRLRSDEA